MTRKDDDKRTEDELAVARFMSGRTYSPELGGCLMAYCAACSVSVGLTEVQFLEHARLAYRALNDDE